MSPFLEKKWNSKWKTTVNTVKSGTNFIYAQNLNQLYNTRFNRENVNYEILNSKNMLLILTAETGYVGVPPAGFERVDMYQDQRESYIFAKKNLLLLKVISIPEILQKIFLCDIVIFYW